MRRMIVPYFPHFHPPLFPRNKVTMQQLKKENEIAKFFGKACDSDLCV